MTLFWADKFNLVAPELVAVGVETETTAALL
jgi:hypothetical protein